MDIFEVLQELKDNPEDGKVFSNGWTELRSTGSSYYVLATDNFGKIVDLNIAAPYTIGDLKTVQIDKDTK